jgi:hypothetical protein
VLAEIAITNALQGNTDALREARQLLDEGHAKAEKDGDLSQVAFYYRSFARIEHVTGALSEARGWTELALQAFANLGMKPEEQELHRQLHEHEWPSQPLQTYHQTKTMLMP